MARDSQQAFFAELEKRLGKLKARPASKKRPKGEVTDTIPTGLDVLDHYVLGGGGYPCRRMIEVAADEGLGKSSLLFAGFAGAQSIDANTVYFETENRLDRTRMANLGVDLDRIVIVEPPYLEALLDDMEETIAAAKFSKAPTMIGWDSLAACPTEAEVKEGLTGKAAVADRARILSRAIRVLSEKVATSNVALVIVNQLRTDIKEKFGNPMKSVGGKALQYYATVRLAIMGGTSIKKGSHVIGKAPVFMAHKNLAVEPFRKARCFMVYREGWHNERTLLEFGKDQGIIPDESRMSEENIERIREVCDLAEWDPLKFDEIVAQLDGIKPEVKTAKTTKPAKKPAAKKKTTKRKTKKKAAQR
jgi:recombination protein RecA